MLKGRATRLASFVIVFCICTIFSLTSTLNTSQDLVFMVQHSESPATVAGEEAIDAGNSDIDGQQEMSNMQQQNPEKTANVSDSFLHHSRYAYAFVIGGCDPHRPSYRPPLYNVLMAVRTLQQKGSTSDFHAFIQMAYHSTYTELTQNETKWLTSSNISIHYIPKYKEESFYKINLEKFRLLQLTDYHRVTFLDTDVLPLVNLDYLMELSDRGVLNENVVMSGTFAPVNGGFFILRPVPGSYERVQRLIHEKDKRAAQLAPIYWDKYRGWGHGFQPPSDYWMSQARRQPHFLWDFFAAAGDQGLLYHWTKYERQSVSIIFPGGRIENWGSLSSHEEAATDAVAVVLQDSRTAEQAIKEQPHAGNVCSRGTKCLGPVLDDVLHFAGPRNKPWNKAPPPIDVLARSSPPPQRETKSYWYWSLFQLAQTLEIPWHNLSSWNISQRSPLGVWPNRDQVKLSLLASNFTLSNRLGNRLMRETVPSH